MDPINALAQIDPLNVNTNAVGDVTEWPAAAFYQPGSINVAAGGAPVGGVVTDIHNKYPYHDININLVQYLLNFPLSSTHHLSIEYASHVDRSCTVHFFRRGESAGAPLTGAALVGPTGGWATYKWRDDNLQLAAAAGATYVLQLSRGAVFPHIRRLKLVRFL